MRPDEYDLERSRELEARLERDKERESPRYRRHFKETHMFTATTRTIHASPETNGSYLKPWVWPLPALGGCTPRTLATKPEHIELGYELGAALPQLVPVFAAHEGVCVYAGKGGDGFACVSITRAGGPRSTGT
jgi:hypothetical protein